MPPNEFRKQIEKNRVVKLGEYTELCLMVVRISVLRFSGMVVLMHTFFRIVNELSL
jgi:hypothetical protein